MTFKEFLNQKDHKPNTVGMKPPEMGTLQVVKDFNKELVKLPDLTQSPVTPNVSPSRPSMSPMGSGGRSFLKRLESTPRKPSHFLPRKTPGMK